MSFDDELAQLADEWDDDRIRSELYTIRPGRLATTLLRPGLHAELIELLRWIWTVTVAADWPRRQRVLQADIVSRTTTLAAHGWSGVIPTLGAKRQWLGDGRLQINRYDLPERDLSAGCSCRRGCTSARGTPRSVWCRSPWGSSPPGSPPWVAWSPSSVAGSSSSASLSTSSVAVGYWSSSLTPGRTSTSGRWPRRCSSSASALASASPRSPPSLSATRNPTKPGSASGSFSSIQQLASAIGSAAVTSIFFQAATSGLGHAMKVSLIVVLAVTALSLPIVALMPRKAPSEPLQ